MNKNVFLTAGLLLCIFSHFTQAQADSSAPSPAPAGDFLLYLPFAAVGPHLDARLTAVGEDIGYPTRYFACGVLNNSTGQALYSSRVDLLVAIQGYLEPDFYPSIVPVTPAFSATLPGQPNPFQYSLLLGHASAQIRSIQGTYAHPWSGGPIYHRLYVEQYACTGGQLAGKVRNNSSLLLAELRVVAMDLTTCAWGEAAASGQILPIGGLAEFQMDFPGSCTGDQLLVVGQGTEFH